MGGIPGAAPVQRQEENVTQGGGIAVALCLLTIRRMG